MGKKSLIITVGGSDSPVVSSINRNKPDYVFFLCSRETGENRGSIHTVDSEGKPCGENSTCPNCGSAKGARRSSIVAQANLAKEAYEIVIIKNIDDFNDCYLKAAETIERARKENPVTEIIADYTCGTKSMSAGLAAAAMDDGDITLCIVKGHRPDLHKVKEGTQSARKVDSSRVFIKKKLLIIDLLWKNYDYSSCKSLIDEIYRSKPISLDSDPGDKLGTIEIMCAGFEAWDRFDHYSAADKLKLHVDKLENHFKFLGKITCVRENWPENLDSPVGQDKMKKLNQLNVSRREKVLNFAPVIDLILNARRRASQGRYDDAVARLYRALEMFAQINLLHWEKPLFSSDLEIEKLPEKHRKGFGNFSPKANQSVNLGLMQSYELLFRLNTPVGRSFNKHKQKLRQLLDMRNYSLMAHGINPIAEKDYQTIIRIIDSFIEESFSALNIDKPDYGTLQFPDNLLEEADLLNL